MKERLVTVQFRVAADSEEHLPTGASLAVDLADALLGDPSKPFPRDTYPLYRVQGITPAGHGPVEAGLCLPA